MLQYDAISFEKEFPKTILGSSIANMQPKNSHLIWDSVTTLDMFVNKLNITHRSAY